MKIKMPVMVGIKSHANILDKVKAAAKDKRFPVELDCKDTAFTSTGFCRFVITAKKVVEVAGGTIRLVNVSPELHDGIKIVHFDSFLDIQVNTTLQ